jgi:hypothetical protein
MSRATNCVIELLLAIALHLRCILNAVNCQQLCYISAIVLCEKAEESRSDNAIR